MLKLEEHSLLSQLTQPPLILSGRSSESHKEADPLRLYISKYVNHTHIKQRNKTHVQSIKTELTNCKTRFHGGKLGI